MAFGAYLIKILSFGDYGDYILTYFLAIFYSVISMILNLVYKSSFNLENFFKKKEKQCCFKNQQSCLLKDFLIRNLINKANKI